MFLVSEIVHKQLDIWLNSKCLLLLESLGSVPSTTSLCFQPPVTPDTGDPMPFGVHGYIHAHGIQKHTLF